MANTVKLTFTGDEVPLTKSMDNVGEASKRMGDNVGEASRRVGDSSGEAANGLERVGGSADNAERNIIGVHDVIDGTATIMEGPGKQGIVAYLQGWADLAGGIAPMAEYLAQTRVATLAQAAAGKVAAAGSKIWAGAQWVLNSAFLASPITWVVAGIVALVAVIVLIATKTDWFQRAWRASWSWIKSAAENTWNFIKKIPGWIGSAFSKVASFISAPYRAAFNLIADAWNATIGRLSWTVPGWVPFIGGNTISVPNLPHFHSGGVVPGPVGSPQLAVLQGGEQVSSRASADGGGRVLLGSDGTQMGDFLLGLVRETVARKGGRADLLGIATGAVR
jgi:phage-related protein